MNTLTRKTPAANFYSVDKNIKTYTTHARACKYGQVRGASPITLNGVDVWVALPFYASNGVMNVYSFNDE